MQTKINFEAMRRDRQNIVDELTAAGATIDKDGKRVHCFCDAHSNGDKNPSGEIYQSEDGGFRYKCFKSGWVGDCLDVRAHKSMKMRNEIIKEVCERGGAYVEQCEGSKPQQQKQAQQQQKKPPKFYENLEDLKKAAQSSDFEKGGKLVQVFAYSNPQTLEPELFVFRIERQDGTKTFRQGHKNEQGYILQSPPKPIPIYNRVRIKDSEKIIFVEGEGKVHALHKLGFVATCTPMGAGKATHADLSPLSGKTIYVWPDNDSVGKAHGKELIELLKQLSPAPKVLYIDPDTLGLGEKEDVVDLVEKMKDMPAEGQIGVIQAILDDAQQVGVWAEVAKQFKDAREGRRKPIEWPWPSVSFCTRALLPKCITVVCGLTGGTKSLWLMNACVHWFKQGVPLGVMMLEDGSAYHTKRACAITLKDKRITEDEWHFKNPEESARLEKKATEELQGFENCVFEPPKEVGATKDVLCAWMQAQIALGKRILVIDPISLLETSDNSKPFLEEAAFFRKAKRIIEDSEASLILVTHPRKGAEGLTVDDVAGSAVFGRAAQTVMWLSPHENKEDMFRTSLGSHTGSYNRTISMAKVRNAHGEREKIGLYFCHDSFEFKELGILEK